MKASNLVALSLIGSLCVACGDSYAKTVAAAPAPSRPAASNQSPIEKACHAAHTQCLDKPVTISLRMQDGSLFKQTIPPPIPMIQDDDLYVFAGQTLYVEADVDGDKLTNLRLVPSPVHPDKTLTLKFEQKAGKNGYSMSFTIQNPFDRPLKYHAGIMEMGAASDEPKRSSTCPVAAEGERVEMWLVPVSQLVLSGFHLLGPAATFSQGCSF